MDMWGWVYSLLFVVLQIFSLSSCMASDTLKQGRFLHVQKPGDVLVSANGVFKAGFLPVGENAFCFSIWFSNSIDPNHTVVWMANRDQPVNGIGSKLELLRNGKLILTDAGRRTEWTVDFVAASPVQVKLLNTGNLVLQLLDGTDDAFVWQSFNSPTDTLLPDQELTKDTYLISSRSRSNYSSGNYKLYFDNDNVLRLLYQVPNITSVYWPPAWLVAWPPASERSTYNSSRVAVLNSSGYFRSSDNLWFRAADSGIGPLRRLTLDPDGMLRLYSLQDRRWIVSWQSQSGLQPCRVHGICGQNSLCKFDRVLGRSCSCFPGHKIKNPADWSQGCIPEFTDSYDRHEFGFVRRTHVEIYGHDTGIFENSTLQRCKEQCLNSSDCKGFQFKFDTDKGIYSCFPKVLLLDGYRTTSFAGDLYLKLPKSRLCSDNCSEESRSGCPEVMNQTLNRMYEKDKENGTVKLMFWFSIAVGIVEFICIFLVLCILFRSNEGNKAAIEGYIQAATGFRRYTYLELKKATKNFTEEVGRGGAGVVYRGALPDQRIAAIKRLHEADQGEAEFLAEVSTIGRLNHMNLIEMWGYCVEGKHRLLVYEYLEHGSLADNLSKKALNWTRMFEIAVGTAKSLAYLHEECLEWILHCDIKPQNILLDSNFQPKVADFGLSKLLSRGGITSSFSRVRGTRGYMAPEWVYNLPITSKVDVYSYGIVVLEMVTGKSSTGAHEEWRFEDLDQGQERLVPWVREKINGATSREIWIEEVADPVLDKDYDMDKMKLLIEVALQCVKDDMHARPTMSQVVEMLSLHGNEASQFFQGH